jgi:hypothetical protein
VNVSKNLAADVAPYWSCRYIYFMSDRDGNVCRLELGGAIDQISVRASLLKADMRQDCSDFDLTTIMRMLYLYSTSEFFPADLQADIKATFLRFKYWPDKTFFFLPGEHTYVAYKVAAGHAGG